MKIDDLVRKFKGKDQIFVFLLNEIANYVMYEQAIIKKDNDATGSSIHYRYEEKSYEYIDDFFKEIEFLSKPVIGSMKKVIVTDLPSEYKDVDNHEISFNDKIYLLDKIKDSFMHLEDDDTLYELDYDNKVVIIKNITSLYSLECKIPFSTLYKFNRNIKNEYDNSVPSLEWIDSEYNKYKLCKFNLGCSMVIDEKLQNFYAKTLPHGRIMIYNPKTNFCYFLQPNILDENDKDIGITKQEYDYYHINSYVSLLVASMDKMNYPLLDSIYDFDFQCEHSMYVSKMTSIIKKMTEFYIYLYNNIDNFSHDILQKKIIDFLYSIGQNGKEKGLLVDISDINNMIVKKYMRNARSHANNKGVANTGVGNQTIIYHDVLYNSLENESSDKRVPSFVLIGKRKELDSFFDKLIKNSLSNHDLYKKIVNDLYLDKQDTFELFLQQLSKFIDQASKDKIKNSEYLKTPIGNAKDFVDFIRKNMSGNFEYEEDKDIKRVL